MTNILDTALGPKTFQVKASRVDFGRVLERTFATTGQNFWVFYSLSIISFGIPQFFTAVVIAVAAAHEESALLITVVSSVPRLLLSAICRGALFWGVCSEMMGRRRSVSNLIQAGLRVARPLVGISICYQVSALVGLVLFVVPGLFMATVWSVAAPARVMEEQGVWRALRRSGELTRGHRWATFGLIVIGLLIFLLGLLMSSAIIGWCFRSGFDAHHRAINAFGFFSDALEALVLSGLMLLGTVGTASLYHELRYLKEGDDPDVLGEVFA